MEIEYSSGHRPPGRQLVLDRGQPTIYDPRYDRREIGVQQTTNDRPPEPGAIRRGPRLWESRDGRHVWLDGQKHPLNRIPAWKTELDQMRRRLDALMRD